MGPRFRGKKCCMPFHPPGVAKERDNVSDFPRRNFFCDKFGFASLIPFPIVDPVFSSAVTTNIHAFEMEQSKASDAWKNHAWKRP